MKTKLFIIAGILFSTAFLFIFSFSKSDSELLKEKETKAVVVENEEKESCCSSKEADQFSESSIYQLNSDWYNQNGSEFMLSELKGKPVVLTMFFASCTYACPILVNDMKKIESSMTQKELSDYKFVLVSIDPERDTPAALKKFAVQKELDLTRWTLLTGSPDDIMELAAVTGFKYTRETDGQYSHSNLIMILNEEGEIIHQHVGLNQDLTAALTVINNL